ncbi:hypothetical protein [Singulisphaera sp. PoT]|uniref:hypothetical protein n=1 Tax=Singulisphaera sp. PoT TaxID=3411797 RepID=UPI003BF58A9F
MPLSAKDYIGRVRDSVWERDLASHLRQATEQERLAFVSELAKSSPGVALVLARRTLAENRSYEVLLDQGLAHADASGIRPWLECVVPRLGFRKVLRRLGEAVDSNPDGVAKALYWLPSLATPEELARDAETLAALCCKVR